MGEDARSYILFKLLGTRDNRLMMMYRFYPPQVGGVLIAVKALDPNKDESSTWSYKTMEVREARKLYGQLLDDNYSITYKEEKKLAEQFRGK